MTNGKVLYTDATIKILQYMNKLVKMTLKGRLENLDSEFFADGFLFGKILLMERARTQAYKRVFMGNKLRIEIN